ncbi:acyltransferase family protein [Streptomyces sp. NPDC049879]|uniref:acyltransferase family protein n=1 Tax=Streptomyces sp. NPDC049879 TaxID=3365598 RepID=UPI0037AF0D81
MSGSPQDWSEPIHGPAWTLWLLQALFLWRVALPRLARLRYPLATSIVVALVAGYLPLDPLPFALSRAVALLPLFLLGWKLRQGALDPWPRGARSRTAATAVLGITCVTAWLVKDHDDRDTLSPRETYGAIGLPLDLPWAWTVRCVILLGGMATALSVIRLAPAHRLPLITYLASGGLYIYLLNPLLLRPLNAADAFAWIDTVPEQATPVLVACAISVACASPGIRRLTRPFVQPGRARPAAGATTRHRTISNDAAPSARNPRR